ncbi:NAD(P)-binding protein [Rhizobium laguerreae]|uniref:NAD(P)-binding protein n=1 Tax=Rhizobium laguerreae TaxID=1076926 RepID=UPI001C912573|nr:NAD(P)-binding protein [Rhizobium laguerreae]MBY3102799.1 NAD(P)-binding protein [Rhizobium laguerreae]
MKVIIAGAGIAGLAAAQALEIKGHQCEVYEQCLGPRLGGAGIFLLGNATRALDQLGVLEPLKGNHPVRAAVASASYGFVLQRASMAGWRLREDCG